MANPVQHSMENSIEKLDCYQKLRLIGEGSFGQVYKAVHLDLQKTVALKIIAKKGRSGKELSSLKRECEIQKHLTHPNIIKFIESFETPHEFVLITEFAHMSLSELLDDQKRLSEARCVKILSNLVSALYYLHSNRVLHRDLKPQNVLMTRDEVAMLCDFGFARCLAAGTHVLTSIKGTPLYMAPELIAEKPYDHTADLWSLGCIAYEIYMGYPPFKTVSILHLIRILNTQEVTFPPDVSKEYQDLVKGLLEKDASRRLSWPQLIQNPLLQSAFSLEVDSCGVDFSDMRRGSRIPSIVESESDGNEEWVTFLRNCLRELLSSDEEGTALKCERGSILLLITSLRSQSSLVIELITHILVTMAMKYEQNDTQLRQVFLETRVVSNLLLAIKNVYGDATRLSLEMDACGQERLIRIFMFLNYLAAVDHNEDTQDQSSLSASSSLRFLHQLCDAIVVFKLEAFLSRMLVLHNALSNNILAIFILMVTQIRDSMLIVENVLHYDNTLDHVRGIHNGNIQEKLRVLLRLLPNLNREP